MSARILVGDRRGTDACFSGNRAGRFSAFMQVNSVSSVPRSVPRSVARPKAGSYEPFSILHNRRSNHVSRSPRYTDSLYRLGLICPTYVRTYVQRTINPQSFISPNVTRTRKTMKNNQNVPPISNNLRHVLENLARSNERLPVIHRAEDRRLDRRIREAVLQRDGYACQWCKAHIRVTTNFEIDHIIPWSAGGTNATDNLRTLCAYCNQERSNFRTDSEIATARLIIQNCPRCYDRHYVSAKDSETGEAHFVYEFPEVTVISSDDKAVPVWCRTCRTHSATNIAHANHVRQKQAHLYGQPDDTPEVTDDDAA